MILLDGITLVAADNVTDVLELLDANAWAALGVEATKCGPDEV